MSSLPALGVLVPCRDEAAVIDRRLMNLAGLEWPPARAPHRVVVVDDGSSDDTAARARAHVARMPAGVTLEVLENRVRPGKSGAIAAGLAALRGTDVVVLTDADVVLEPQALDVLARAFAAEPGLAMASGSQRFVRALADDGSAHGPDEGEPGTAASRYDRWTARVRRLESRRGRVFSVHGQLLAWRADLGLAPTPGLAADDLDLMLQARLSGGAVRLLPGARFLEVKLQDRRHRELQELRRARAYVQFLRHPGLRRLAREGTWTDRLQIAAYRWVPRVAPWMAEAVLLVALWMPFLWALWVQTPWRLPWLLTLLLLAALRFSHPVRGAMRTFAILAQARQVEARGTLSDRWETPRAST